MERKAIRGLNADKHIIILPADKGNATVVMKTDDYHNKIADLLDPNTYRKLKSDPTAKILRATNRFVKGSAIPPNIQKEVCHSEALPPRLYGLPKVHKPNVPLRPIVSAINSPTYRLAKYLTRLLQPFVGQTESFIKNSAHFVEKLGNITLRPNDIILSFDVVSLFTMVPVDESLTHLAEIFPKGIIALFEHCLKTTYFQWNNEFYEQIDGVAMGNPLSPVIANFYMERFEQQAIQTASKRPSYWFRYVDDVFLIWSYGEEELDKFHQHINNINPRIQFTMEKENNNQLPFLDVLVTKREDGKCGHKVYRKPTHTDRYLHKTSNHHPRQKRGIIKTLVDRAHKICEKEYLHEEITYLQSAFQSNGYSEQEIKRALHPRRSNSTTVHENPDPKGKSFLPYIKNVTDRIGKLLERHDIKTIFKPTRKIREHLRSAKDRQDHLSAAGVYSIPCSCGQVYVGTTKRSVNTRISEHKRCCRLGHTDKSAVAEHALQEGDHRIRFEDTKVLDTTKHYYPRLHREAIEIHKHVKNFNRKEEGLKLNKIWIPLLKQTQTPINSRDQSEDRATASPAPATNKTEPPNAITAVVCELQCRKLRPRL